MSTDTTKTIDEDQEEQQAAKRTRRQSDPETRAIQAILWELDELPDDCAKSRVVAYIADRFARESQVQQTLDRR